MNSHPALSTEQQVCTHRYQKYYSVLSRLHQCAVHRMSTARFSLSTFSLKVCFVLITSKGHHFIPEPLICLCRQWDVKRHFWHLFPICAPTQKPPEQVLFRFHLLSACLSPRSPAVQGKPRSYLSKETDKKNMCAPRRKSSLRSRYLYAEVRKTGGWNISLDVSLMDSLLFCFTTIIQLCSADQKLARLLKSPAERLLSKCKPLRVLYLS